MTVTTDNLSTRAVVTGDRTAKRPNRAAQGRVKRLIKHIVLILIGFVMLYPLLWMVGASLKPEAEIFADPSLIPRSIDASSYGR